MLPSQEFISTNSVPDYLKKAQVWIDDEKKRADLYLDPSSKPKLLEVRSLFDGLDFHASELTISPGGVRRDPHTASATNY